MTPPPTDGDRSIDRLRPLLRSVVGPDEPVEPGAIREVVAITLDTGQVDRLADALETLAQLQVAAMLEGTGVTEADLVGAIDEAESEWAAGTTTRVDLDNPGEIGGGSLDQAAAQVDGGEGWDGGDGDTGPALDVVGRGLVERGEALDLLTTANPEDVARANVHATLYAGDQLARVAEHLATGHIYVRTEANQ